jgi:hypothetical protein
MSLTRNETLIIGDDWEPVTYIELDGVDLTDATGQCKVKSDVHSPTALLTPTFTIVDAALGRFTYTAAASATAGLSPGKAYYSVRITLASGARRTYIDGEITILAKATSL